MELFDFGFTLYSLLPSHWATRNNMSVLIQSGYRVDRQTMYLGHGVRQNTLDLILLTYSNKTIISILALGNSL